MCECLVRFSHSMRIFFLLKRITCRIAGIQNLSCKPVTHGALGTGAGKADKPAETQGLTALRSDFDRNLIRGTADSAGFDFKKCLWNETVCKMAYGFIESEIEKLQDDAACGKVIGHIEEYRDSDKYFYKNGNIVEGKYHTYFVGVFYNTDSTEYIISQGMNDLLGECGGYEDVRVLPSSMVKRFVPQC